MKEVKNLLSEPQQLCFCDSECMPSLLQPLHDPEKPSGS